MAHKIGDICFPAGKYIKDGEEKTRWMKVGIALQTDKGIRLKLDAIPAVYSENGLWLSVFEERDEKGSGQGFREKPAQTPAQRPLSADDDVPF